VLVAGLVLGLTTLNAMVAQSSFRVDDLQARVEQLRHDTERKQFDYARLTAPDRIAKAAQRIGLHRPRPGEVQVIRVPGSVPGRGAGGFPATDAPPAGGAG
jgi:hypothetical protein